MREKYNTCNLSGDWTIFERKFAFSWTLCTRTNSALEIWKKEKKKIVTTRAIVAIKRSVHICIANLNDELKTGNFFSIQQ